MAPRSAFTSNQRPLEEMIVLPSCGANLHEHIVSSCFVLSSSLFLSYWFSLSPSLSFHLSLLYFFPNYQWVSLIFALSFFFSFISIFISLSIFHSRFSSFAVCRLLSHHHSNGHSVSPSFIWFLCSVSLSLYLPLSLCLSLTSGTWPRLLKVRSGDKRRSVCAERWRAQRTSASSPKSGPPTLPLTSPSLSSHGEDLRAPTPRAARDGGQEAGRQRNWRILKPLLTWGHCGTHTYIHTYPHKHAPASLQKCWNTATQGIVRNISILQQYRPLAKFVLFNTFINFYSFLWMLSIHAELLDWLLISLAMQCHTCAGHLAPVAVREACGQFEQKQRRSETQLH